MGKEVFRKGGMQERIDSLKEGCRRGGMQERNDAGMEGYRKVGFSTERMRGITEGWDKGKVG